ncbi:MAG: FAD-dependent monooxygenase [Herpetosiphonaceae bacterium]|nr:FAD-dependent monooxygenase [Herpetosiphonaceae bacterium]
MELGKAIIIGGGIGGLAAAIGLRRRGFAVEVFERAAELREVGAGISIWRNGISALKQLGLETLVQRLSMPALDGGLRSWNGTAWTGRSTEALPTSVSYLMVLMHRAELHAALLAACGADHVHLGAVCTGFRQDPSGVTALFADGAEARGDLLIGADGLHSAIRRQLHGEQPPTYAGYTAWRSVVGFDHQRLALGESWGSGARFGQIPLSEGRVYWFATANAPAGQRSPGAEREALLRIFGSWHRPIRELIEASAEAGILRNDIYDRPPLRSWGEGRVTLLGDAAHPMTPNLGQGACQALEDAVVLQKSLSADRAIPAALQAYERQRIPRTTAIARQSRRIGQIGQWHNPLALRLRELLFRNLPPQLQARQLNRILNHRF